ncbi:MAG: HAMP domain-containing sensor histidine kinase [Geodermatophilaceae bacterium]
MSSKRGTGRWRRRSLRARLLLIGTAGLAIGLAAGGIVLVAVLKDTLERTVDTSGAQTARDVAALIDAGRLPDPIPTGGTTIVQVVDDSGQVRAASAGADRLVSILRPAELVRAGSGDLGYVAGYRFGVDGVVRVVTTRTGPRADPSTVVVATPAGDIARSVAVVRTALLVGYAVLLAVLAALAWRVVGATLRPVEALRRGAAEITGAAADGSLPVPDSRDEIHALAVTLNDMLARLAAARRRQRAFVADAAHELRSPLTSLRTQLEVAAAVDGRDGADLLAEVDRMSRLVEDLLVLARVDDDVPRQQVRTDLAGSMPTILHRYAGGRVPVTLTLEPAPPVRLDPDMLPRVVHNLVDNAVRHATGSVLVAVGSGPGGTGQLVVTDDGPGIPVADRERVFDRFTRLAAARDRDTGGSGLGLAIVRGIVQRSGGTVELDAADPPGLRVTVTLPPAPP